MTRPKEKEGIPHPNAELSYSSAGLLFHLFAGIRRGVQQDGMQPA